MPWSITPCIWSPVGQPSTAATTARSSVSAATISRAQATLARRQARKAEEIMRFVDRFRAKTSKARQVQSRLKALEKLQLAAPGHADSPYEFSFPNPTQMSPMLIQLENASLGYDGKTVVSVESLRIAPGSRIGVLGANGAGKTTLDADARRRPAAAIGRSCFAASTAASATSRSISSNCCRATSARWDTCGCARRSRPINGGAPISAAGDSPATWRCGRPDRCRAARRPDWCSR